ncbi:T9SS type A sorting domain-containing protein [candidate division KSB1 bacterium]|nr:T9SS type A sorting domain-containing protein [candidate division KSB1 bacterium]
MKVLFSKSWLLLLVCSVVLITVQFSWAANTPWWWSNPQGYPHFHRIVTTGSVFNASVDPVDAELQAQLVTAVVDVPNEFNEFLAKDVWVQVEWTVSGSGEFIISGGNAPLMSWLNNPGACPVNPRDPFPTPDGQGQLMDQDVFTPAHGFDNGREFSFDGIIPQPACERLLFNFIIDPDSRIDYRIEVQTICLELDWGDAPDDPGVATDYPTLSSSDGARHAIVPGFNMGTAIDRDPDGQPNVNADGDDLDSEGDDEDAIDTTPIQLLVGMTPSISIPVTADVNTTYTVRGWIDLDGNGSWADPGESASVTATGPGTVVLNFTQAPSAAILLTYARFRLSTSDTSIAEPTGIAPDGEVEDYTVTSIEQPQDLDFGDAPTNGFNYPVMFEQDGGRHTIVPNFYLGSSVDMDTNGQPTGDADGDDLDIDGDDEDITTDTNITLAVGVIPSFSVPVVAPIGQSFSVSCWIDMNDDGDWDDSDEFAQASGVGTGGTTYITVTFPQAPTIPTDRTYIRFRLCSQESYIMSPAGEAPDGEVEDYTATILSDQGLLDFGDVPPDGNNYPLMLSENGGRHIILSNFHIGDAIDMDTNGQGNAEADGDDLDIDGDDEDAFVSTTVTLSVGVIPSFSIPIMAPVGQSYSLSGWIDLNADGDWTDVDEFAQTSGTGTGALSNVNLVFPTAPAIPITRTYMRLRLCSDASFIMTPAGEAPDGEVEDYVVIIEETQPDIDFGDAPDPNYPSLLASDGARHTILPGLLMGSLIDGETDSHQLAGDAAGDDDDDGNDDEDGVDPAQLVFTEGQSRNVTVNVSTPAFMTVYVYGWVDYNGDQVWDASEQASGQWTGTGAGQVILMYPVVPAGSATQTSGHSYARFRVSSNSAAIALPTGPAPDGEVEDYPVDILVPVELSSFTAVFVNNTVQLDWTTQTETENLGFHVFRSASLEGNYNRITQNMIPGAGTSQSVHHYQFTDQTFQPGKAYYYKLADINYNGVMTMHGPLTVQTAPQNYGLDQNYPNPFNPQTKINYKMMQAGDVELGIYNLRGQLVRRLVSRQVSAGEHSVIWDGRDDTGQLMPSGTYLYRIKVNDFEETKKMELLK